MARNGQEAIQILESNVIDFAVTDLNMPIMVGIELLAYMSTKFPTIPAIAMTGFSTLRDMLLSCIRLGDDYVLTVQY